MWPRSLNCLWCVLCVKTKNPNSQEKNLWVYGGPNEPKVGRNTEKKHISGEITKVKIQKYIKNPIGNVFMFLIILFVHTQT